MKILLVRLGGLGDLIMLTPTIRALKKQYKTAKIDLLVSEKNADLLKGNKHLDKIIIARGFDKSTRDYKQILNTLNAIRSNQYGLIFNFHNTYLMNILLSLCGSKTIGFNTNGGFLNNIQVDYTKLIKVHNAKRYASLANAVGAKVNKWQYELFVNNESKSNVRKWLKKNRCLNHKLIGIVPGGSGISQIHLQRRLPIKEWKRLIKIFKEKEPNTRLIIIGDSGDLQLSKELNGINVLNSCGLFNLNETCALIQQLDCLISNDTGPMHIGAALTKVVALFMVSTPEITGPLPKTKHRVLWNNKAADLITTDGFIQPNSKMSISAEEIYREVKAVLND